jgi:hypothetical protein
MNEAADNLLFSYAIPFQTTSRLSHSPRSHSIVLNDCNTLNSKCEFFLHTMKNRIFDPSEICALDFKREFRRFEICLVSVTIDIYQLIF